ncbi:MAG: LexA family protein [Eubacteriales bacterium]
MERLKELRVEKKLLQKDVANYLGVNRTTYVKYETGASQPDNDTLKRLADLFGVSLDYLLGRDSYISTQATIPEYDNIFRIEKKRYPLLGDIACGQPIYADEDHESYILSGGAIDADFCLRAKGDSMVGARILDGDIVFIKETPTVQNGEIAAVIIGDEATLKRVYYYPEKGKLVLSAENPKYEPFVFVGNELNDIRILGKAVAFQSVVR